MSGGEESWRPTMEIDEAARMAFLDREYLQPERRLHAEWPALERILLVQ